MSLKSYIFLMFASTVACFLALLAVINFFDPFSGNIYILMFFYVSLFFFLVGFFSVIGLIFRILFSKNPLVFKKVTNSFRQSLWFALLIIISLIMQSQGLLALINLIVLIAAFTIIELFFISYKKRSKSRI